jgi:hypothetical protein
MRHSSETENALFHSCFCSLKPWGYSDVERFCKDDPYHGNNIKKLRSAGVVTTAGKPSDLYCFILQQVPLTCMHFQEPLQAV